ncbi:PREDICTED: SOSS complex subunit B homolog isoform X4 [Lupinus angustifolius]|nr:PREDICTED: SOSS complex subunit B homolog isoform X4 [Lupinus angustifolius]
MREEVISSVGTIDPTPAASSAGASSPAVPRNFGSVDGSNHGQGSKAASISCVGSQPPRNSLSTSAGGSAFGSSRSSCRPWERGDLLRRLATFIPLNWLGKPQCSNIRNMILLKDIAPAAENNIETKFILLDKGRVIVEGQHKTCLALVADETASVHFQLWGDECDAFEAGDMIDLTNGIFSKQRNNLVLRAGKRGKIMKIGEFTMSFVETPNMSEIHWVPDPTNSKKYIQGHVISTHSRLFPPIP